MTGRRAGALLLALAAACAGCGEEVSTPPAEGAAETALPSAAESRYPLDPMSVLDCPEDEQSVWMTDPGEPPPGVSVADVLDQESDPATGAEAVVLERRPGYVLAGLREPDGRTLSVIHLDRWPDVGSWYVEGGADCGR